MKAILLMIMLTFVGMVLTLATIYLLKIPTVIGPFVGIAWGVVVLLTWDWLCDKWKLY